MTPYLDARQRVLEALKAAGPKGITTWELIHQAHHSRAVGRIWELSKVYEIEHVREPNHVHRWIYKGLKPCPTLLELMA
jgi:hypothetical protein